MGEDRDSAGSESPGDLENRRKLAADRDEAAAERDTVADEGDLAAAERDRFAALRDEQLGGPITTY